MSDDAARAVVITGASTGIGRACAIALDAAGFRVFAGVRRVADGEALVRETSARLTPVTLEVTDAASIDAALATVRAAVGDAGLAGLVNNAGISGGAPLECHALHDVRRMFDVNFFGAVAVTQAFLPLLRLATGRVVFVGAAAGRVALPFLGAYSATKYAIEAVADALRVELTPWGIAVAVVEPGSIDTPIFAKSLNTAAPLEDRYPPATLALYREALEGVEAAVRQTHKRGLAPATVAEAVVHALSARRPRTRYPVGADARVIDAFARRLPDRMRDAILARQMGLSRRARKG